MEEKENFLKHKSELVKSGWLGAIAGIFILLSILLLIFVPIFKIEGENEWQIFRFSIFDDFVLSFKMLTQSIVAWLFGPLLTVVGFLYLIVGIILFSVDIIKLIIRLRDVEGYALIEYDDIVKRYEQKEKTARKWNALSNMIYGLFTLFFAIFLSKRILGEDMLNSFFSLDFSNFGKEVDYYASYSAYMTGLTIYFYFAIALVVFSLLFRTFSRRKRENVRLSIVKEKYNNYLGIN